MKNNIIFSLFIFGLSAISFTSCKSVIEPEITPPEEEIVTEQNDNINSFKIVWKTRIDSQIEKFGSSYGPFVTNDKLVITFLPIHTNQELVKGFDIETGLKSWDWDDNINQRGTFKNEALHIDNNTFYACSGSKNYAIDLTTGQTKWSGITEDGTYNTSFFFNRLYHTISFGNSPTSDSTHLIYYDVNNGNKHKVYSLVKTNEYEPYFEPPVAFLNEQLDTILIFQNRTIKIWPADDRTDWYCYNMTKDTLLWYLEDIDRDGISNITTPIIEDNKMYYLGQGTVFCIDIHTGEILFERYFGEAGYSLLGSNFVLYKNYFIFKRGDGIVYGLDKKTGATLWTNTEAAKCCVDLHLYGDRIYICSGEMYILDANTGKLLHKLDPPLYENAPQGAFYAGVYVDVEEELLYTTDGRFLLCMELPE